VGAPPTEDASSDYPTDGELDAGTVDAHEVDASARDTFVVDGADQQRDAGWAGSTAIIFAVNQHSGVEWIERRGRRR